MLQVNSTVITGSSPEKEGGGGREREGEGERDSQLSCIIIMTTAASRSQPQIHHNKSPEYAWIPQLLHRHIMISCALTIRLKSSFKYARRQTLRLSEDTELKQIIWNKSRYLLWVRAVPVDAVSLRRSQPGAHAHNAAHNPNRIHGGEERRRAHGKTQLR